MADRNLPRPKTNVETLHERAKDREEESQRKPVEEIRDRLNESMDFMEEGIVEDLTFQKVVKDDMKELRQAAIKQMEWQDSIKGTFETMLDEVKGIHAAITGRYKEQEQQKRTEKLEERQRPSEPVLPGGNGEEGTSLMQEGFEGIWMFVKRIASFITFTILPVLGAIWLGLKLIEFEPVREAILKMRDIWNDHISPTINTIAEQFDFLSADGVKISLVTGLLLSRFQTFRSLVSGVASLVLSPISALRSALSKVGDLGKSFGRIGSVLGRIASVASRIFFPLTLIYGAIGTIQGAIEGYHEDGIVGAIRGAFEGLVDALIAKPLDLIKEAVAFVSDKLGFDNFADQLRSFSYSDLIGRMFDSFWQISEDITEWIIRQVTSLFTPEYWKERMGDITDMLDPVFEKVEELGEWLANTFGKIFSIDFWRDQIASAFEGMGRIGQKIAGWFTGEDEDSDVPQNGGQPTQQEQAENEGQYKIRYTKEVQAGGRRMEVNQIAYADPDNLDERLKEIEGRDSTTEILGVERQGSRLNLDDQILPFQTNESRRNGISANLGQLQRMSGQGAGSGPGATGGQQPVQSNPTMVANYSHQSNTMNNTTAFAPNKSTRPGGILGHLNIIDIP